MNGLIKISLDDTIYDMYQSGWITKDLYLNGGVSFDLIFMYKFDVVLIADSRDNYYDNACNYNTVEQQMENYLDLIHTSNNKNDDYTDALLGIAHEQLSILDHIKGLLIVLNN